MTRSTLVRFGAFAAASVFLTWWIAGEITGRSPADAIDVQARFDDVSGLVEGDDVRLAGIPVGRVTGVDVDQGQAVVQMRVDQDIDLPADSGASIRWRNLIGQRYVSLRPGEQDTLVADGAQLAATDDVVDLGRIVNQLAPLAQSVGPEQVNRILTGLVVAFEGNEAAFDGLVADLASLSAMLADRDALLAQMQGDFATISDALAERDQQIAAMVGNLASVADTLDATDDLLARGLDEFGAFAAGADSLLTRSSTELAGVLERLPVITGAIAEDLDLVERAIRGMPAMMDAVLPTINRGPYLRVNLLCITAGPGRCPHPLLFFEDEGA